MSEKKSRRLVITKANADECKRLNALAEQALTNVQLYVTSIVHTHGITSKFAVHGVDCEKDGQNVLLISET